MDLNELLSSLTLEEKVGQLVQLAGVYYDTSSEITGPLANFEITDTQKYTAGSIIGVSSAKEAYNIQKEYLEKSSHKIPLLFMADVIHGSKTIFPIPLGASSSFNPSLIEKMAKYSAIEAANMGVQVTFSPMADLARDARWGRNMETNGEDPYLNKVLTSSYVRGYQGGELSSDSLLISCVKHFAAYGLVDAGREYNTVDLSKRLLLEQHYPAYESAIKSGSKMVMSAFNTIDSVPVTANKKVLDDDLRNMLGFDGVVISDWAAITELINHRVAMDSKDSAKLSIDATVDIDMMSMAYKDHLVELVNEGVVSMELIDNSVKRILEIKKAYGLFDNPFKNLEFDENFNVDINQVAKEVALESIVLLKNKNNILPMTKNYKVYGKHVSSSDYHGPWSWQGDINDTKSIESKFGDKVVEYRGSDFDLQFFSDVDNVILFIGETSFESGEAKSKTDIRLSKTDVEIIKKLKFAGKNVVACIFAGRPLDLSEINDLCDGIIYAWFPGSEAASAIYDLITGVSNFSAKLSMSLPRTTGQCPIYYNDYPTGRPFDKAIDTYVSKYIDTLNSPLYTFSDGLTYSNVTITDATAKPNKDHIVITCNLENHSDYDCMEVIQVYVKDCISTVIKPERELKAFKKVRIAKNTKSTFEFNLNLEELKLVNNNEQWILEDGDFELYIGLNVNNVIKQKVGVINGICINK